LTKKEYNFENVTGISLHNPTYSKTKIHSEINIEDKNLLTSLDVDISRLVKICVNEICYELRQIIMEAENEKIDQRWLYRVLKVINFGDALEFGIAKYLIDVAPKKDAKMDLEYAKRLLERREKNKVNRWSDD